MSEAARMRELVDRLNEWACAYYTLDDPIVRRRIRPGLRRAGGAGAVDGRDAP